MERGEATVDNDLTQIPTRNETEKSNVGTGHQPAGEAESTPAIAAPSRPQPEAASSFSSAAGPAPGRDPVSAVDPDGAAPAGQQGDRDAAEDLLLPADQRQLFTAQWSDIQAHFVDQPRQAVKQADGLVVDIMQRVTAGFSHERERLEAQWEQGDDVSTEDLRVALTRYRSFFDRLIST